MGMTVRQGNESPPADPFTTCAGDEPGLAGAALARSALLKHRRPDQEWGPPHLLARWFDLIARRARDAQLDGSCTLRMG
jgi:hypothetical protein